MTLREMPTSRDETLVSACGRSDFAKTMKGTVWMITVEDPDEDGSKGYLFCGGVCIHSSGLILSSSSLFSEKSRRTRIILGRMLRRKNFTLALIGLDFDQNLALLKVVDGDNLKFDCIRISTQESSLNHHVATIIYRLNVGHASNDFVDGQLNDHLVIGTINNTEIRFKDIERQLNQFRTCNLAISMEEEELSLPRNTRLIQISGFPQTGKSYCCTSLFGFPAFASNGHLIGLIGAIGMDFSYVVRLFGHLEKLFETSGGFSVGADGLVAAVQATKRTGSSSSKRPKK